MTVDDCRWIPLNSDILRYSSQPSNFHKDFRSFSVLKLFQKREQPRNTFSLITYHNWHQLRSLKATTQFRGNHLGSVEKWCLSHCAILNDQTCGFGLAVQKFRHTRAHNCAGGHTKDDQNRSAYPNQLPGARKVNFPVGPLAPKSIALPRR